MDPVFSGRSYGERLEMGTESEKSRIIIMKSVLFFESYFNSLVQKLEKNNNYTSKQPTLSGGQSLIIGHRGSPEYLSIQLRFHQCN
jgi:hypothetical protein